ncbi:ATPase family AAA domain-containing protein 2-like [Eudromia elegans]
MEAFCSTFLQSLSQQFVRFRKENPHELMPPFRVDIEQPYCCCPVAVQLAGVGNMYIMENYLCAVKNKSCHVRRPVLQLDPVFLLENNLSYENIPWPGHLEVAQVKPTTLVMRTHLSLQKVSVCLRAAETLLVWALSRGEDFDFVFKNIGVLVCRERKVTMRFYEDFLKEVDETGKLSKSFLRKPELRPLIIAHTESTVFQMPPGGVFVFPQFIRKNADTEGDVSEQAERKGTVRVNVEIKRTGCAEKQSLGQAVPASGELRCGKQARKGSAGEQQAVRGDLTSKRLLSRPCLSATLTNDAQETKGSLPSVRNLPTNFGNDDLKGIHKDGMKIGASLLDAASMPIDTAVRFDGVGGLSEHIAALKEMVILPLLYPEVFEKLQVQPPRGCLFYGPPGTGKTLVARALANECSQGARKISFFLRKGADALSKWVGESERQLRLLFEQAHQARPSIIFFDEIDGLAPVRSSGQDQTYSSIVSTLLALMDGLDSRGEVVVIGATNRLDSIDPALRRPGRFDREFLFRLPDKEARKEIFKIHTRNWTPKPLDTLLEELAEKSVGYCGADIKAACAEAALRALQRCYPQIYKSTEKLQLDASSIKITAKDFVMAMEKMVPASQRSVSSPAQALSPILKPLLKKTLKRILQALQRVFPHAELFIEDYGEVFHTQLPTKEERRNFFEDLILNQAAKPPVSRKEAAWQALEVLPLAPPPEPRKPTQEEMQQIEEQEEDSLRELRIFLRDLTHRLTTDRRFKAFTKPVDLDEVPDYTTVIKQPMDLSTITSKIDLHQYLTAGDFLKDIDLICSNALEYNPDREPGDRLIRHRACSLRDVAYAIVKAEMDEELEQVCKEIKEARKKRVQGKGLSVKNALQLTNQFRQEKLIKLNMDEDLFENFHKSYWLNFKSLLHFYVNSDLF